MIMLDASAGGLFLLLILAEGQALVLWPIPWQLKQCTVGDKIKNKNVHF